MNRSITTRPAALPALLGALLLTGCHTFQPVEPTTLTPGITVRAYLEETAAAPQGSTPGFFVDDAIEGEVISADEAQLVLEYTHRPASPVERIRQQRVALEWAEVSRLEEKTLDRRRTAVVTTASSVVALGAIAWLVGGWTGADTTPGPGNGIAESPVGW